jgi:hypothetical protein
LLCAWHEVLICVNSRHRPSSITKLKDMITSWADEEDMANAKYDAIRD